jgi:hypothetical protein
VDQPGLPSDPRSIGVYPTFASGVTAAWKNYLPLLAIYVVLAVPMITLLVIGCPTIFRVGFDPSPGTHTGIPAHEWIALAGCCVFALGLGSWTWTALYRMADAVLAGEPRPGLRAAYGESLDRVPAVIGSYVAMFALVVAGFVFCILPGIFVANALHFAPARASTRERGPLESIRESFELVKGRWWRVFGFTMLVALCVQAVYLPVALPLQLFAQAGGGRSPWFLVAVFALSVLIGVFQASCTVALHRRLEELGPVGTAHAPPPIPDDSPADEPPSA